MTEINSLQVKNIKKGNMNFPRRESPQIKQQKGINSQKIDFLMKIEFMVQVG